MNDNRFGRGAYKNLLSNMGSTLIANASSASSAVGGDENFKAAASVKGGLKAASSALGLSSLVGGGAASVQQQPLHCAAAVSNAPAAATAAAAASLQLNALATANASIRNALGDIGNRIGLSNVQQQQQFAKKESVVVKCVEKQLQQSVAVTIEARQVTTTVVNPNNTCVMDEVESDEDEAAAEEEELEMGEEAVLDIDKDDGGNTQLVAEYVQDVYEYLGQLERQFRVSPHFLDNKIVTCKMRAVLVDWLIQVHLKFQLLQETLYLCIHIIDAYLQAVDVPKMQLQLVGVTAMFLASKYEEMYVPAIDDFVYMTDNTYTKHEIRQMEISILKTLNFLLCKPLPLNFLRRFSKAGQAEPKHHNLAKYFMELSLHDADFSSMDPSYLAACSLSLSFKLFNGPKWNRTMEHYSKYKQSALWPGMQKIAKLVLKSMNLDYKYRAVTNKYGASKFQRISLSPELGSAMMKEIAAGHVVN